MLSRLMPREGRFFDYFKEMSDCLLECSDELRNLLNNISDPAKTQQIAKHIEAIEIKADDVKHKIFELLHSTFITPLDREDIHVLSSRMDDIVDYLNATAQRVVLFEIRKTTPEIMMLANQCHECMKLLQVAVNGLSNLKRPKETLQACVDINRIENDADNVFRAALASMFKNEDDVKNLLKWKDLYEYLETITDRCEEVAEIIEGIILDYA